MIEFKPGDEAKATDAVAHLVNFGKSKAMYRLMGAGFAIAKTTQALGTLRHGQLLGKPQVRQVDDETVHVGFQGGSGSHGRGAGKESPDRQEARMAACAARVIGYGYASYRTRGPRAGWRSCGQRRVPAPEPVWAIWVGSGWIQT